MGLGAGSVLDSVVHPGLHAALVEKFYPTDVVVERASVVLRPNGEQVVAWEPWLLGLSGNLARAPRANLEQRGPTQTTTGAEWSLNLAGWYPQITVEHRVVVTLNGQAEMWNIRAVVHDSLSESTRLEVERTVH
jgi:hypothetical protein